MPDEKILEMKTAFAKYDVDGSGMLSNDEFRRIAPDMGVRHGDKNKTAIKTGRYIMQLLRHGDENETAASFTTLLLYRLSASFSEACLGKTNAAPSFVVSKLQN